MVNWSLLWSSVKVHFEMSNVRSMVITTVGGFSWKDQHAIHDFLIALRIIGVDVSQTHLNVTSHPINHMVAPNDCEYEER
jgi:hypothetical protein